MEAIAVSPPNHSFDKELLVSLSEQQRDGLITSYTKVDPSLREAAMGGSASVVLLGDTTVVIHLDIRGFYVRSSFKLLLS
jgi:hypothetical protein